MYVIKGLVNAVMRLIFKDSTTLHQHTGMCLETHRFSPMIICTHKVFNAVKHLEDEPLFLDELFDIACLFPPPQVN